MSRRRPRSRFDRREFLKLSAIAAGGLGLAARAAAADREASPAGRNMATFAGRKTPRVRVGIIGLGNRGPGAVSRLSRIADVEITALGDLFEDRVGRGQRILKEHGRPPARAFHGSESAWEGICDLDLDLVYICTPWRWHAPMAVRAMRGGKHAASEVPAAVTLDECWQLVETSEKEKRHMMMLENTCYDFFELATLVMVRKGVLGEIVHAEGAYIHDLLAANFDKNGYQGMWRLVQNRDRNGSLYPTHGLGPIAQCLNVNRGDVFTRLVSLSCGDFMMGPRSRELAAKDKFYEAYASDGYRGQMNTTLIGTRRGKSVMIQHDVTSPRPYSRIHLLSGTKGIVQKWPVERLAFGHEWLDDEERSRVIKSHRHPLAAAIGDAAREIGGHGGMDFIMDYRLVYCLKEGLPLDQNCYDAATWSAVAPLSEASVARRSEPVDFPDFTRGRWKTTEPLGIVTVDPRRLRLS